MLEEISAVTGTGERRGPPRRSSSSNGVKVSALMSPAGNVKQKPLFPKQHRRRSRQLTRQKKVHTQHVYSRCVKISVSCEGRRARWKPDPGGDARKVGLQAYLPAGKHSFKTISEICVRRGVGVAGGEQRRRGDDWRGRGLLLLNWFQMF